MALRIAPITSDLIDDLGRLLATDRTAGGCSCRVSSCAGMRGGQGSPEPCCDRRWTSQKAHGASAIEGLPLSGGKRRSDDRQVGFESLFAACGFKAIRTPSPGHVIMRKELIG
jgi:hypothetical protein